MSKFVFEFQSKWPEKGELPDFCNQCANLFPAQKRNPLVGYCDKDNLAMVTCHGCGDIYVDRYGARVRKMGKFRIGEKVIAFNNGQKFTGTITGQDDFFRYFIDTHDGWLYESQLKRLKPKVPLRIFWLNRYKTSPAFIVYGSKEQADKMADLTKDRVECIKVREVREKKPKDFIRPDGQ